MNSPASWVCHSRSRTRPADDGRDGTESWVEVGGAAILNVFGVDGIERLAMRKYDITDIRLLHENDLRFFSQF